MEQVLTYIFQAVAVGLLIASTTGLVKMSGSVGKMEVWQKGHEKLDEERLGNLAQVMREIRDDVKELRKEGQRLLCERAA